MKKALFLLLVVIMAAVTACQIEPAALSVPAIQVEVVEEQQAGPVVSQDVKKLQGGEQAAPVGLAAAMNVKQASTLIKAAAGMEAGQAGMALNENSFSQLSAKLGVEKRFLPTIGSVSETLPSGRGSTAPQPMPFQDDPYTHPSGAFTFAVPEGWELYSEDEAGAIWVDDQSALMALFVDAGYVYSKQEMNQFVLGFISSMFDNYQILEQRAEADGSTFVAIQFDSGGTKGDGDYYFEQRDTVVFVLYFGTTAYEEMLPTWEEIIDSYSVDPTAVVAPVEPDQPSRPGPRPLTPQEPAATPTPEANPFAPQAGRSRLYVFNEYNQDLTFTINNGEHKIAVNAEVPIDMDAGKYTYTISVPGAAVNGEVEMGPNQSWAVGVRGDGAVYDPFQVYP